MTISQLWPKVNQEDYKEFLTPDTEVISFMGDVFYLLPKEDAKVARVIMGEIKDGKFIEYEKCIKGV